MERKNIDRSVVYNWTASYLFILMIPVLAIIAVYFTADAVVKKEILNVNRLIAENIKSNMDNTLRNIEEFSLEVASSPNVRDILTIKSMDDDSAYYRIYTLSRQLHNYHIFNDAVRLYYIYYGNIETVVSSSIAYLGELYFDTYLKTSSSGYEDWRETMSLDYKGAYLSMSYRDALGGERNAAGFVRSIPQYLKDAGSANLVVILDAAEMIGIVSREGLISGRSLFIVSEDGEIIAGDSEELSYFPTELFAENEGNLRIDGDSGKMIGVYNISDVNNWRYVILTPEIQFWHNSRVIRAIMLTALGLCLVFGTLLSFYFLRKNYHPLKEVVSFFRAQSGNPDGSRNEFSLISEAFSEVVNRQESYRSLVEKQNLLLRDNFFMSMLKGRSLHLPVNELMTNYQVSFPYGNFLAVAADIVDMDEMWEKDTAYDRYDLVRFAICNVVEEILNRNYKAYLTDMGDIIIAVVNMDAEQDWKGDFFDTVCEVQRFIFSNLRVQVSFGVSAVHDSVEGFPSGYSEAVSSVEYLRMTGDAKPVFYDDITSQNSNVFYFPPEKEYQLINCVKSGDFTASESIVNDIFEMNYRNSGLSSEMSQFLTFALINAAFKIENELAALDENYKRRVNTAAELMKLRSHTDIRAKFLEIVKEACGNAIGRGEKADLSIRDDVVRIIRRDYHDRNLSIAGIAEEIGKYTYYVSRMFKQQTGESILEYINQVRIKEAKELMKTGRLNQTEIAEKVGYTNVRTFQRIFKKMEGTTPGKTKD